MNSKSTCLHINTAKSCLEKCSVSIVSIILVILSSETHLFRTFSSTVYDCLINSSWHENFCSVILSTLTWTPWANGVLSKVLLRVYVYTFLTRTLIYISFIVNGAGLMHSFALLLVLNHTLKATVTHGQ